MQADISRVIRLNIIQVMLKAYCLPFSRLSDSKHCISINGFLFFDFIQHFAFQTTFPLSHPCSMHDEYDVGQEFLIVSPGL